MFPPKLARLHYIQKSKIMAESSDMTWKFHNEFIPPFVSKDLKWFERDGLEIWYRSNKCEEFLENTDLH